MFKLRPTHDALPDAQWEFLVRKAAEYGLRVTDLTPAMAAEADELLKEGKLLFWSDDTHWNGHGTATAARIVAETLRGAD